MHLVLVLPSCPAVLAVLALFFGPQAAGEAENELMTADLESRGMLHITRQIQHRYPEHATAILIGAVLLSLAALAIGLTLLLTR